MVSTKVQFYLLEKRLRFADGGDPNVYFFGILFFLHT